ncbi:MAG: hypothetical protein N2746_12125, partial [Deltaproteobacteria bacterium]|nr:hypothetical protein [Deltaproteobacteria bacterium]
MKRLILVMVVLSLLFCFCSEEGENYKTSDTPGTDHVVIKDSGERDTILADEMGDDSSFTDSDMDVGELTDSGEIRDVEEDGTGDIKDTAEITDKEENRDVFYEDVYADASDISQDTGITDTQIEDINGSDAQGTDTSASDYIVSPVKFCRNLANPCNPIQTENRIFATYRKDYYLSDSDYNEYTDYPLDGGRFHIAMVSSVTGKITSVFIDGENAENMLIKPKMEWYHYWPENVKAGEVVWFAFHSRDKKWDSATAGNIKIETDNGTAVNGAFEVRKTKVPLTYITTTDDMSAFLIYMQNTDSVNHVIKSIKMNAREVFTSGIACVTDKTIRAGETALIKVPLCTPAKAGEPFTVVVEFEATNPSVGVGRVIKPLFPIEAWPNSSECPVPGGNQTNYQAARTAFIDTVFVYMDNTKCNLDWFNLVNRVLPGIGDFYVLIADNFTSMKDADKLITNTSFVAAFMTGDESDGEVWDENNVPIASKKAKESQRLWSWYPEVPTYNGAKTNGNVGTFAGMADIQGIDFYVAACAPHITAWGKHPPLRGAYDYLKNTRNNHMPL